MDYWEKIRLEDRKFEERMSLLKIGGIACIPFIFVFLLCIGYFLTPESAQKTLEKKGYTNIVEVDRIWSMTGVHSVGGDRGDWVCFIFSAQDSTGKQVLLKVFDGGGPQRIPTVQVKG